MVAQGENLHQTLAAEYHNEYHVQVVQHSTERFTLLVMVHCHCQHIESDEQHDYHIELFIRHYFKHNRLRPPLKKKSQLLLNRVLSEL